MDKSILGVVQMFAYDTVRTFLIPKSGEPSRLPLPVPVSLIAGASAGVSSTITMYPLELLKTRLTVEVIYYRPKPTCLAIALDLCLRDQLARALTVMVHGWSSNGEYTGYFVGQVIFTSIFDLSNQIRCTVSVGY